MQAAGNTIAGIMRDAAKRVPSYIWLLALPQLISRICHSNSDVNELNKHIITHVTAAFPQQVKRTSASLNLPKTSICHVAAAFLQQVHTPGCLHLPTTMLPGCWSVRQLVYRPPDPLLFPLSLQGSPCRCAAYQLCLCHKMLLMQACLPYCRAAG